MDVENMTVEELENFQNFIEFKNTAKELFQTIKKYQRVSLFDRKKIIWEDSHNKEYLITGDGVNWVWVADYLHQNYRVSINIDDIYSLLKDGYLFDKDIKNRGYVNKSSEAMSYFRAYVAKLKRESIKL